MVQIYEGEQIVYPYPFEQVMKAYHLRWTDSPECKLPYIQSVDIVSDEDTPEFKRVTRRIKIRVEAPSILVRLARMSTVEFIQVNTLYPTRRILEIEARLNENDWLTSRVNVLEKCKYYVSPNNPAHTCFSQTAKLEVFAFLGFEKTVERLAVAQYAKSINRGKDLLEHHLEMLRHTPQDQNQAATSHDSKDVS